MNDFLNNPWTIGIGTAVIAGVILTALSLIVRKIFGEQNRLKEQINNQTTIIAAKEDRSGEATLKSQKGLSAGYLMVKKIDNQPPYMQEAAEEAYIGQVLEQNVKYNSLRRLNDENNMSILLVSKEGFPWINGVINLQDYPWLKTLKSDATIRVSGRITKFHGHVIELAETKLYLK